MNRTVDAFTRRLANLESAYRRLDSGQLTGRNSSSSDETRELHYRALRDMIAADAHTDDAPLCTYLDEHPKLAARWDRLERRSVGLPY